VVPCWAWVFSGGAAGSPTEVGVFSLIASSGGWFTSWRSPVFGTRAGSCLRGQYWLEVVVAIMEQCGEEDWEDEGSSLNTDQLEMALAVACSNGE
jgi:hypothetical protein